MNAPSTTTTVTGSSHHASVRRVAPGMTSPLWLPKARLSMPSLPRVLPDAVLVEIAAVAVVDDDGREALDLEPADGLCAQVLVGHHLELLDECGEHGARATDGPEVDGLVLAQSVLHRLRTCTLADRALQAERQELRGELVHTPACGRPDGAHDVAGPRGRRPRVVDDLPLDVDGKRLAGLHQRQQASVRGVACSIDDPRDADAVAGLQGLDVRVAQRRRHLLEPVRCGGDHSVTC